MPNDGRWKGETYYEVAVFWPKSGEGYQYGGHTRCDTLAEAEAEVETCKLGGFKHVHIRKVTIEAVSTNS